MSEAEKLIAGFVEAATKDLASHKAALDRLAENQEAQHAKLKEFADELNAHSAILEALRTAVEAKLGKPLVESPGSVH
jgi:hypothetical protein